MQKIIPHLWFESDGREATEFYVRIFDNSSITNITQLPNTPSGTVEMITLKLENQDFMFLTAGPLVKFNPSVSFLIACLSIEEVNHFYNSLVENGSELMPLGKYDFCEHYAWVIDRFGISWQIMYMKNYDFRQKITPTIMFVGKECGKAEEAIHHYTSLFDNSKIDHLTRYHNSPPNKDGTLSHAEFTLNNQIFAVMDSAYDHPFSFNEAISLIINCETQEEIDKLWDILSSDPQAEQCGWLKDKYGFSWQISPMIMYDMLSTGDNDKLAKITEAFLKMKKFDLLALKAAFDS